MICGIYQRIQYIVLSSRNFLVDKEMKHPHRMIWEQWKGLTYQLGVQSFYSVQKAETVTSFDGLGKVMAGLLTRVSAYKRVIRVNDITSFQRSRYFVFPCWLVKFLKSCPRCGLVGNSPRVVPDEHLSIGEWIQLIENGGWEKKECQPSTLLPRTISLGDSIPELPRDKDLLRQVIFKGHQCQRWALNVNVPQSYQVCKKSKYCFWIISNKNEYLYICTFLLMIIIIDAAYGANFVLGRVLGIS